MQKIIRFKEIDSTQDYAKKIAEKSVAGTIVIAEQQTKGRGQFERGWSSQKGGLYFSIILKPEIKPQKISVLTHNIALAIVSTLSKIVKKNYTVFIKPPNDVMVRSKMPSRFACGEEDGRVGSPRVKRWKSKKVAGILTESSIIRSKVEWVVVGVGVNINNKIPKNLKGMAISLKEITGQNQDIKKIFKKIVKKFVKIKT
ncbi:MAG: biotin--[acetyl-CoA-carboxylase] ligase [Elusimicrobiota bacterium]